MEPTGNEANGSAPRHQHYPSMTGEKRLAALRSIRGMWKGQAQKILKQVAEGREDREIPVGKE